LKQKKSKFVFVINESKGSQKVTETDYATMVNALYENLKDLPHQSKRISLQRIELVRAYLDAIEDFHKG